MSAALRNAIREVFEAGFRAAAREYGADRVDGDMAAAWNEYAAEHLPEGEES